MAGNGTIGLEILEDLPDPDVVLVPFGGGGLSVGIASAVKQLRPETRVYAVEPETGAPLTASFAAGEPRSVEYRASFVDGSGAPAVLDGDVAARPGGARRRVRGVARRDRRRRAPARRAGARGRRGRGRRSPSRPRLQATEATERSSASSPAGTSTRRSWRRSSPARRLHRFAQVRGRMENARMPDHTVPESAIELTRAEGDTASRAVAIDTGLGSELLELHIARYDPGRSQPRTLDGVQEVMYAVAGQRHARRGRRVARPRAGHRRLPRRRRDLRGREPGAGDPARRLGRGAAGGRPTPLTGRRTVRYDDQPALPASGDREFRYLVTRRGRLHGADAVLRRSSPPGALRSTATSTTR